MHNNNRKVTALKRRELLVGLAAAAAGTAVAAGTVPRSSVGNWDWSTDILVAGSGAAGVCAAIEARQAGAQVLLLESLPLPGGSSSLSGGVVYLGGGTALQRALKIEDTPEAMYNFLHRAGGVAPPLDKIQVYCEQSREHFDWLVAQGIPYAPRLGTGRALPTGEESLYFSGTELAWPAREYARPAPRGHVPGIPGVNGGRSLMQVLLDRVGRLGVVLRTRVQGERLITESDGRVVGMVVGVDGERRTVRARRGVVLTCGGFIHNREMLSLHAPQLSQCSVPWGGAGDLGQGINMGVAAGAASLRMSEGFASVSIFPPEATLEGILVNSSGQRFISEESYGGLIGHAIAFQQAGKAWLVTDQGGTFGAVQDDFPLAAESNTIGELAAQLAFPRGALQNTVAYYNRYAANGSDPLFQKSAAFLRPLQGPPYRAWDLSVRNAFFPAYTFGGLRTSTYGEVYDSFGELIPGLYAAGRTTAGLPTAPAIASGISLGDATFFGRRAGRRAAEVRG